MAALGYRPEDFLDIQRMPTPDNFAYVVPVDYLLHIPEKPFCFDAQSPCHEDDLLIY